MQREVVESSHEVLDAPRACEALSQAAQHFAACIESIAAEVARTTAMCGPEAGYQLAALHAQRLNADLFAYVARAAGLEPWPYAEVDVDAPTNVFDGEAHP